MPDTEIVESLRRDFGAKALELTNPDRRRVFLKVAPADLVPAVTLLRGSLSRMLQCSGWNRFYDPRCGLHPGMPGPTGSHY